jgi:AraC-like DNA-binding protein
MTAEFEPTADQRALVENAAAFGLTQADIANQLNIDEKTLRKHFREALNSGKFKVDMLAGREAQSPPRAADVLGYPFETLHGQRREKSRPRLHRADEAVGQPEEIANAIVFLASEEASFTTGQVLSVDGGKSAG